MADVYEKNLNSKASLTVNDYIRVVGSDNVSYKQLVSDVANKIITTYTGASLAGSNQSVKSALDSLNSNINNIHELTLKSGFTGFAVYTQIGRIVCVAIRAETTQAISATTMLISSGLPRPYNQYTTGVYKVFGADVHLRVWDNSPSAGIYFTDSSSAGSKDLRCSFAYLAK